MHGEDVFLLKKFIIEFSQVQFAIFSLIVAPHRKHTIRSRRVSRESQGQTRNERKVGFLLSLDQFRIVLDNLPFPTFRVRKKLQYNLQNTLEILCDILQRILETC